ELLQDWVADERLHDARLAVLVPGAAAVLDGEAPDPRAAAIRGLVRSAQSEHPGRIGSIDAGAGEELGPALATGEAEVAVRDGAAFVPRLVRAPADTPPPAGSWRLAPERAGALVGATPAEGDGDRPLRRGEVRLAVRAAGVSFRDVLVAIGVHGGQLGIEAAGVVAEVGPGVAGLAAGDRVMGLVPGAFGPLAVADARMLVPIPAGWSFAQAATVPLAHAAAQLALVEVARLAPGERVLVHAAAGGVGMAAVQLARSLGAEVFATASPAKWGALRALGLDDEHIASSRSAEFGARFAGATGGAGVDVVLNCLTGELVDASLGLLARGGRFVELGTADVRDAAAVAAAHPGVRYETLDLLASPPQRLAEILGAVAARLERGELAPLPLTAWDVRDGSRALELVGQARHVGKVVLTVAHALDPHGTVLVTGGTGGLGAVVAEHLARAHGVRHLLLASRRGARAPGVAQLQARLAELGCEATVAACDVGDRAALARLLDAVPPERPLTAVVHAAGALENAMIGSLDRARLDAVMRPKADAARWLDELTRDRDLAAFVMFSSVAATFSHPGQGNYAAANAYLDGLAQRRRARGLPATAVAWGLWATGSGMSTRLTREDVEVLAADTGQRELPAEQALALLDVALVHREPLLVATTLDLATLRAQARTGVLPALLSELVRAPPRRAQSSAGAGGSLARELAAAAPDERQALVLELVRAQAAAVLGHASGADVEPDRPFKELGFDSLGSVVLRNRLAQITGLRLPSTLVFDHPTPAAMAAFVRALAEREEAPAHAPAATPSAAPAPSVAPAVESPPDDVLPQPRDAAAPSPNGAGAHPALAASHDDDPPGAPDRRYRGPVLGRIAGAARAMRFRAWVLTTQARLVRLRCRLVVEVAGTPRFDELPRIVTDAVGEGGGSLTLRIGRDCRFGRELTLDLWTHADGVLEIGDRCQFQDRIRLQPWGGAIRVGEQVRVRDAAELKSKGELVVGADSFIGRNATVHCHERIELAEHVNLAEGVNVMDSDHTHDGSDTYVARQPVVSAPVVVGRNVFVGTNALILRGSRVGRNAMVATGSVLTGGEYPERHLLAGAPAQPLRPLRPDEPVPS
ncbi:MAG TPA: SDR family NAD(P)-dependent oxidoreductase, partial [Solirubrobacteraceae bacterium]|nr:SDR family NAD(P)-dependent oxidoreductase [Solirubrobacteraceae bacterium]